MAGCTGTTITIADKSTAMPETSQENAVVAELSNLVASLSSLSAQAQSLPLSPPASPQTPPGQTYRPQLTDYSLGGDAQ